jgi:hypothetical protein
MGKQTVIGASCTCATVSSIDVPSASSMMCSINLPDSFNVDEHRRAAPLDGTQQQRCQRRTGSVQCLSAFSRPDCSWFRSFTNRVMVLGVLVPVGNQSKVLFAANSWNSTTGQPLRRQTW